MQPAEIRYNAYKDLCLMAFKNITSISLKARYFQNLSITGELGKKQEYGLEAQKHSDYLKHEKAFMDYLIFAQDEFTIDDELKAIFQDYEKSKKAEKNSK